MLLKAWFSSSLSLYFESIDSTVIQGLVSSDRTGYGQNRTGYDLLKMTYLDGFFSQHNTVLHSGSIASDYYGYLYLEAN